jgi:diguanylate cyclase (GGDEF)-like protein
MNAKARLRQLKTAGSTMSTMQQVRGGFWLCTMAIILVTMLRVVQQTAIDAVPTWVSLLAAVVLAVVGTWGWRRGGFPWWTVPVDITALFLLGAGLDRPTEVFGVLYQTMMLRNLHGRHIPAIIRSLAYCGVGVALVTLQPSGSGVYTPATMAAWQLPSIMMFTATIRILAGCLHRLEAARAMSATLAATAGSMLATDRPERIRELAEEAATRIVPDAQARIVVDDESAAAPPAMTGRREVILPLKNGSRTHGRLTVITSGGAVRAAQRQSLTLLAAHTTSALEAVGLRVELHRQANHDLLTGLANRGRFGQALIEAMAQPVRLTGVIFIDLDNFKWVNDTLGHAAGDSLLIEVADRLRRCVRDIDLPARLGGDEFAVLVEDISTVADVTAVADRLLKSLTDPVDLGTNLYQIRCSIGIAAGVGTSEARAVKLADELLQHADAAMYEAKNAGKNRYQVFGTAPAVRS